GAEVFGAAAAGRRLAGFGQAPKLPPVRARSVTRFVPTFGSWTTKTPPLKLDFPSALVSARRPFVTSTCEPMGTCAPPFRVLKVDEPGSLISAIPLCDCMSTLTPGSGGGSGALLPIGAPPPSLVLKVT